MITRKRFLLLGSLSIVSTLIPCFLFSNTTLQSNPETLTLLKNARKYRKQGKLKLAQTTYQEVLVIDPTEVRAYNGIRKILLSKKNKEYEVIQLYQQALIHLPNNLRIKRSLYNEYFKAALGNRKVLNKINISGRMLTYVKGKYEEIIETYPEKKNLQKQLEKLEKYIQLNVDNTNPHNNISLKLYRKEQRKKHKRRFDGLSAQKTTLMLTELEAKPVSDDRAQHIREMARVNIKALRSEKRYSEAFNASEIFLTTNNAIDPYFIKQFRDLAKQLNEYERLLTFEIKNHTSKTTFWSAISLFDAYFRKAEVQNQSPSSVMDILLQFMTEKADDPNQQFEIATRKIKIELLKNNLSQAKENIINQCGEMMGISASHYIDRMNIIVAKYYKKTGNNYDKNNVINIAVNPRSFIGNNDEIKNSLALMNMERSYENPIHIQNLQKKIASL
ncbi:tetratricopeptide repeat protein [Chryseobacterium salivictor]|uniref:Uncharacterized protein n=1 Tax=Chryseobacterium salivictor TaxID=2547600 RepID=A0A4P6ZI45_9FLAO|nr:hypothetical protein [Chryseobacterium salivictor]QBO59516.1 hypothetical protein NBC122_02715 [Chryseobacterium salivictor]